MNLGIYAADILDNTDKIKAKWKSIKLNLVNLKSKGLDGLFWRIESSNYREGDIKYDPQKWLF